MTEIKELSPEEATKLQQSNTSNSEEFPNKFEMTVSVSELQKKSLFVATPMYGGQCLFSGSLITTEDGPKTIKNIVDTRYSGKVLSFDEETKDFVWNKVIGWSAETNKIKQKKWIRLNTGRGKNRVIVSTDHECAFVEDILNPVISFAKAETLDGKYIVKNTYQKLFNKDQISLIVGTLLGNSSITKLGAFRTSHCLAQKGYLEHIKDILGGDLITERIGGFGTNQFSFRLSVNAQTNHLRNLFYIDGKKTIKNVIPYIDEISLAYWYMDDGYLNHNYYKKQKTSQYAMFCTDGFSLEDCELLVNLLKEKWNITASVIKYRKYYRIAVSVEGSKIFWDIVSPYIHEEMKYKLPENTTYDTVKTLDNNFLNYSCDKVKIIDHNRHSKLYDITVENNHNFVADNFLVHNCAGMYTRSIIALSEQCQHYGIKVQMYFMFNESLITRARNYCVDEFLRSGCTHLLFIDADIGFNPQDVMTLLALQDDNSPYDVIGGPYPKKCISWEKIVSAVNKGFADDNPNALENFVGDYVFNPKSNGQSAIAINKPVEVLETGTGFMMIRRKTFEDYAKAFPELSYKPDHVRTEHFDGTREIIAYFDTIIDPVTRRYLSEDYMFCYNVQKMGGSVWLCPWMQLQHVGSYVFGGSLAALAAAGVSPTADPSEMERIKKAQNKK
jgi:uncharacterized protein YjhX (UPF0386 family)